MSYSSGEPLAPQALWSAAALRFAQGQARCRFDSATLLAAIFTSGHMKPPHGQQARSAGFLVVLSLLAQASNPRIVVCRQPDPNTQAAQPPLPHSIRAP